MLPRHVAEWWTCISETERKDILANHGITPTSGAGRGCFSYGLVNSKMTEHANRVVETTYQERMVTLPGMENAPTERVQARAEAEGQELTAELLKPGADISKKAGRIERESPLFFGTGENPTLF